MKQLSENSWARITIIIVTTVLFIAISLGIADAALFANKIHRGVEVAGVSLGGKTREEAAKEISKLADELESKPIDVRYQDKTWSTRLEDMNARIDREATLKKAFGTGRSGGTFKATKERFNLWFRKKNLKPVLDYDRKKFAEFTGKIAEEGGKPADDAGVKIVNGQVVVTSSENGRKVDEKILAKKILDAFASIENRQVDLPVKTLKPDILEDDLTETKKIVKQMIKAPVIAKYQSESWTVMQEQIIDWISFNKERRGDSWELAVGLKKSEVTNYLKELTASISIEPKDAKFEVEDDKVTIIPSQAGREIDFEKAIDGLTEACKSIDAREVLLSTAVVEPKMSTEDAQKMGIKEKVSTYTTYFNPNQISRVHNIKTLAAELDGNIIAPGETFSVNGNLGPRTADKGYGEAMAIINGKLVPTLGGGICQVVTTLFNTVFFGGYEVVERHNHSLFISHYPAGRDATVSYGGPDLKFKNNTPNYILISTKSTPSSVTISFYSTDQGMKVEYTTSKPSNFKSFPTKYEEDPTLPKGTTKVVDKGVPGQDITVTRTIKKDGVVIAEDKFFSRYKPQTALIQVGTMEVPADETKPDTEAPVAPAPAPSQ